MEFLSNIGLTSNYIEYKIRVAQQNISSSGEEHENELDESSDLETYDRVDSHYDPENIEVDVILSTSNEQIDLGVTKPHNFDTSLKAAFCV
ncbi:unnamed protein product [Brachionus calyciflorus]|uniref:Uncharacterized protein n=1 Tax=Brachionus calyciflorus TaxID=104777 RepID=A0A814CVA2_9BILA|nr:unnamed protein product [Brachionus calyciflorus]